MPGRVVNRNSLGHPHLWAMTRIFQRLGRHRWLHSLVAFMRIYPVAELLLSRYPLYRRLKPSALVYRVTSLDELSTEFELFIHESYSPALDEHPVETFIDLGCNAGWFVLWLTARLPDSRRRGLLVDGHPRMVDEAVWHLTRNGLANCRVVHGAVGLPPGQTVAKFHLHPSRPASSVLPYEPGKQLPVKGRITEIMVPAISVAFEWVRLFGDSAVDLLKVDIEGKELDFVIYEGSFIQQRVRRIVIEWHKWCVSLERLDAQFESIRFVRRGVHEENDVAGLAIYENLDSLI
jgi:FkbM family methyltransferase